jgi:bacteriocin biosynthesis cyclodehydratase domain-containing protein
MVRRSGPDLPRSPRLHRSYFLTHVPNTSNLLLYREGRGVALKPVGGSDLLPRLLDLLDGSRSVDSIVESLAGFDTGLVLSSLESLQELGLLEDASADPRSDDGRSPDRHNQRLLLSHLTSDVSTASEALAASNVVIVGSGAIAASLASMLAACGVGRVQTPAPGEGAVDASPRETPPIARGASDVRSPLLDGAVTRRQPQRFGDAIDGASLVLAALDHPDPDLLDALNEACLDRSVPLLPIMLVGWEGHLGPTCIPGQTACVRCASLRVKANLSHYQQYVLYEDTMRRSPGEHPFGRLPHFPEMLAGMAATEAVKLITRCYPPSTHGRLVVTDLLLQRTDAHDVLRVPRCPACGRKRPSLPDIVTGDLAGELVE